MTSTTHPTIFKSFEEIKDKLTFDELLVLANLGYTAQILADGGVIDDS